MTRVPHPFPYQGSKRNLAPVIAQYLPGTIGCFLEPFAGAAAMSLYLAAHRKADNYIIGDLNQPLIKLWQAILDSSYALSEKYEFLWQEQLDDEESYYNFTRDHFNKEHKPEQFLYLLARCVKAAVRYNNQGHFNQSRDKRRLGMNPYKMRENLTSVASLLYGRATFYAQDYRETLEIATLKDVIYMDPPYQGTSSDRDKRYINGLSYQDFVASLRDLNKRSIPYLVSYDGRTGEKQYGQALPLELELQQVELPAGRSSQATLLGRDAETFESLYLSPALLEKLAQQVPPEPLQQRLHF